MSSDDINSEHSQTIQQDEPLDGEIRSHHDDSNPLEMGQPSEDNDFICGTPLNYSNQNDTSTVSHSLLINREGGREEAEVGIQQFSQKDKRLVTISFTMLGIGMLLPWNVFVSAEAYFQNRIRLCSNEEDNMDEDRLLERGSVDNDGDESDNNFMLLFGLLYNLSGVLTLAVMLWMEKSKDRERDRFESNTASTTSSGSGGYLELDPVESLESEENGFEEEVRREIERATRYQRKMIVIPMSIYLTSLLITTIVVMMKDMNPILFEYLTYTTVLIFGCAGAFAGAGIVSFATTFPVNMGIQPYVAGQALGGAGISLCNLFFNSMDEKSLDSFWETHCLDTDAKSSDSYRLLGTVSCQRNEIHWGTFAYFSIGCIFLASCIVLFIYLDRHPITHQCRLAGYKDLWLGTQNEKSCSQTINDPSPILELKNDAMTRLLHISFDDNENNPSSHWLELEHHKEEVNEVCDETHRIMLMEPLLGKESIIGGNEEGNKPLDIWNVIQIPSICVFLIFFITLTIFPSWTTKLESARQCQERSNRFSNDLFVQFLIVAFNVADLSGRLASRAFKIDEGSKTFSRNLSLASVARVIFFPLFLFCKVSGGALAPSSKIFINDIYPVSFVIIFAFTNGLLSTLAFMRISQLTPAIDDIQRYVSTIINFTVGFGLLCGSLFSFVFNLIGSGHW